MNTRNHDFAIPTMDRRRFLRTAGAGFGTLGLASVLDQTGLLLPSARAAIDPLKPLAPRLPHFAPRAKSVIWLFMNGGQSHVDTWDYKPELEKRNGQTLENFDKFTGFFADSVGGLMQSPFTFRQYGESGSYISDLFPEIANRHADDLAFIHSCYTDSNNHSPALFKVNTGMPRMGFPCVGSWVTYGLGTENQNLPGFVVMFDTKGRGIPKGHSLNWASGFLPGVFQGTALKGQGDPIDNLRRPASISPTQQRRQLDLLRRMNQDHYDQNASEAQLAARIESFELAYRMQMSAPEAMDIDAEPPAIKELYGLNNPACAHFGKQTLLARRLVERGVRMVQIYSGGMDNQLSWDGHADIQGNHGGFAKEVDQPIAALLTDLKRSGLLEETLVICAGEFGRLPVAQKGAKPGRDHNPHAFTTWFAGGGTKGGTHYGETDEIGHKAAVNRVSVHDLHATILHILGFDHTELTYFYNGRSYRLTDVEGEVVHEILA